MRYLGPQAGLKVTSASRGGIGSLAQAIAAFFTVLLIAGIAAGQEKTRASPLTLAQAVNVALEKSPQRKMALAETRAAAADVKEARSGLLPRIGFSETATDGNDPVYVFGGELRQQRFTAADFALNALNRPTPFSNYATRFDGDWNLFDSFATWHSVTRAERMKDAAGRQLERADQEIIFRVVDSYFHVLLAKKQLEVAEQAMKTAEAILGRSKDRYESGVVVQSDYLSAQVRMAARKQELILAQNELALARAQLSTAMGVPTMNEFEPTDTLAEKSFPLTSLDEIEQKAVGNRPDLKRIRAEESAQKESVSMAKSAFGPRVSGFAGWEADNPTFAAGGGGSNWVAGIQLQIDLFQGGAKRAQLAHERAIEEKVAAAKEMATDAVRLEVRRAYYDVDAARQQVDVVRASVTESQESLRINQNRYDSGLATITDLLASDEAARRAQADYWEALYRYYTGYANLELASGTLDSQSPAVTQ